jgi:hypothetical protein
MRRRVAAKQEGRKGLGLPAARGCLPSQRPQTNKSFLVLFFKKELLS